MNAQERQNSIIKEVLMHLKAINPREATAHVIWRESVKQRLDYSFDDIRVALSYLVDRGFVIFRNDPIGAAHLYRIHADGLDYYNQNFAA